MTAVEPTRCDTGAVRISWPRDAVVALAAAAAMVFVTTPAAATAAPDASTTLLDEIGPGWVVDASSSSTGSLGLTTRVFTNEYGRLELSMLPTPPSIDPRTFVGQIASAGLGVPEIEGTGLPDSVAFGGGEPGREQLHILLFAARGGAFIFQLATSPGADWAPMTLLVTLAELQIERAGGPAGGPVIEVPDEVRGYLATDPPPELPTVTALDAGRRVGERRRRRGWERRGRQVSQREHGLRGAALARPVVRPHLRRVGHEVPVPAVRRGGLGELRRRWLRAGADIGARWVGRCQVVSRDRRS